MKIYKLNNYPIEVSLYQSDIIKPKMNHLSKLEECEEKNVEENKESSGCVTSFLNAISRFFKDFWTYITQGCCCGSKEEINSEEEKISISEKFLRGGVSYEFFFKDKRLAYVTEDDEYGILYIDEYLFYNVSSSVQKKVICTALEELLVEDRFKELRIHKDFQRWIGVNFSVVDENDDGSRIYVKKFQNLDWHHKAKN